MFWKEKSNSRLSLYLKVFMILSGIFIVMFSVIGTFLYRNSVYYSNLSVDQELTNYVKTVSNYLEASYKENPDARSDSLQNMNFIRPAVLDIKIGKLGYVYVMDLKGNVLIHPKLEGENVFNVKDSKGNFFIQEIIKKKTGKIIYDWKNPGELISRKKVVYFQFLPELKWIVAAGSYYEDVYVHPVSIKNTLFLTGIVGFFFVLFISWLLVNWLLRTLNQIKACSTHISKGDFTKEITIKSQDEIGSIGNAFNGMLSSIRQMIREILNTSSKVAHSIEHLSVSTQSLSEASQMQTSSCEHMSGHVLKQVEFLEKISVETSSLNLSINSILELSLKMHEGATGALTQATEAQKASKDAIDAIHSIEDSSNRIESIIRVIFDIADQTNLLALNASIEAARAGSVGRGFAVVANEISSLADKSAGATKEISTLIDNTVKSISHGGEMVRKLDEIVSKVKDVLEDANHYSQEMALMTKEQMQGSNQIKKLMDQINTLSEQIAGSTQKNSDLAHDNQKHAEKIAVSAIEMISHAEKLKSLVNHFKVS